MVHDARFDEVFLEVLDRLYSRVALLVGSRHLADDLVQDVYVRLKSRAGRRGRFVEHPNPYGYALATAMNLARGSGGRHAERPPWTGPGKHRTMVVYRTSNRGRRFPTCSNH